MRIDVLGIGFDSLSMDEAIDRALSAMEGRSSKYIVTPNPEIVMLCRENGELMSAVNEAFMVLPDGIGIVHGARILGTPLKQKISGIDFAQALFSPMAEKKMSVFLLGAAEGIAEEAGNVLSSRFSGLQISGTNDGFFKEEENESIIQRINSASPDLLLVCLGSPKQELWMRENAEKLKVGLMAGLGGSLDVFSGNVKRAPKVFQKLGLEWFHRLIKQPSRAKRMTNLPKFAFAVIGRRLKGK
ncbi:MAG: WecB/TagA/CpsF family glycosyltransferase [Clostridiales bacterium]|nr:WecB/TagA/CpsF family glycosyltransferase [Clostridiales bacterium]